MTSFTLADLDAVPVQMEIKHPKTDEPIGVFVEVQGPDSAEFRNLSKAQATRRIAKGDKAKVDLEEMARDNDELLATCVVGWTNNEFFGEPYSKQAVLNLLKNPQRAWFRKQLDEFTDDRKNFFR